MNDESAQDNKPLSKSAKKRNKKKEKVEAAKQEVVKLS